MEQTVQTPQEQPLFAVAVQPPKAEQWLTVEKWKTRRLRTLRKLITTAVWLTVYFLVMSQAIVHPSGEVMWDERGESVIEFCFILGIAMIIRYVVRRSAQKRRVAARGATGPCMFEFYESHLCAIDAHGSNRMDYATLRVTEDRTMLVLEAEYGTRIINAAEITPKMASYVAAFMKEHVPREQYTVKSALAGWAMSQMWLPTFDQWQDPACWAAVVPAEETSAAEDVRRTWRVLWDMLPLLLLGSEMLTLLFPLGLKEWIAEWLVYSALLILFALMTSAFLTVLMPRQTVPQQQIVLTQYGLVWIRAGFTEFYPKGSFYIKRKRDGMTVHADGRKVYIPRATGTER